MVLCEARKCANAVGFVAHSGKATRQQHYSNEECFSIHGMLKSESSLKVMGMKWKPLSLLSSLKGTSGQDGEKSLNGFHTIIFKCVFLQLFLNVEHRQGRVNWGVGERVQPLLIPWENHTSMHSGVCIDTFGCKFYRHVSLYSSLYYNYRHSSAPETAGLATLTSSPFESGF